MITTPTNAQPIKLLWYNTFLLHGFSVGTSPQLGAKPHLTDRARELGIHLQKLVDDTPNTTRSIFALCEVFSPKTFALIHNQLNAPNTRYASGPRAGPANLSSSPHLPPWIHRLLNASRGTLPVASGLYTLTNSLPITRTAAEPFQRALTDLPEQPPHNFIDNIIDWNSLNRGHPLRDPDFWANKGILLTEIDLGPGKIELYSTHLFSGQAFGEVLLLSLQRLQKIQRANVLPFPIPFKKPLSHLVRSAFTRKLSQRLKKYQQFFDLHPPQRLQFQRGQLQQLVAFIIRHHRPENVVLLAGDFNLNAHDPASQALLSQAIDELKSHGIQLQDTRHAFQTKTDACTTIIPNDVLFHTRQPTTPPTFCSDTNPNPQWLDYIFVQKQEAQHTCSINILEHTLRPFPRQPAPDQTMHFLSDHIGLEITLHASPKPY